MASEDSRFWNNFLMLALLLHGIILGFFIFARAIGASTQERRVKADPARVEAIEDRTQPFAKVAIAGADNSALAATEESGSPTDKSGSQAAAASVPQTGEEVYKAVCTACHDQGIGGAPKFGDKTVWAPHIAKGAEVLHQHAIEGYQGPNGLMPPKGGRADLPDEVIRAGVDYMVEHSR
jgi:cytochrome c5